MLSMKFISFLYDSKIEDRILEEETDRILTELGEIVISDIHPDDPESFYKELSSMDIVIQAKLLDMRLSKKELDRSIQEYKEMYPIPFIVNIPLIESLKEKRKWYRNMAHRYIQSIYREYYFIYQIKNK